MEKDKTNLDKIGEPDRFEVVPGLILEDKLRIKTQRRLEKQFNLPISHIFPGKAKDPATGRLEQWEGVDFNFLNNCIPLITIIAQQVDEGITESDIEGIFDSTELTEDILAKNLEKFFLRLQPKDKSKNSRRPNRTRKK